MAVAHRIREMEESSSWIRRMFETGAQLKARHGADKVCDFSLGNPNLDPPPEFQEALSVVVRANIPMKHGYMPNAGYPEVREAVALTISREQGVRVGAENVVMTCGAGGGLNVALKTILNPGDHVLTPKPCFMEYGFYAANHGGTLDLVPSAPDFDLDIGTIEARITDRTAAVLINSPNNPTGRVYPLKTIRELGEMLERKSREVGRTVYLVSDEPYRKIVYDGCTVPGIFSHCRNSILVYSYSKDLSLSGERIGWVAVHPEAEDVKNLAGGFILCNRILGFVNAPALMQRVVARLQGAQVDTGVYHRKRDMLCDRLAALGFTFTRPEGTFYLFPKAPGDDLEFVQALQEELILTVPGRGFGLPGYFRIAFCVEDSVIERSFTGFGRAAERFAKAHGRSAR